MPASPRSPRTAYSNDSDSDDIWEDCSNLPITDDVTRELTAIERQQSYSIELTPSMELAVSNDTPRSKGLTEKFKNATLKSLSEPGAPSFKSHEVLPEDSLFAGPSTSSRPESAFTRNLKTFPTASNSFTSSQSGPAGTNYAFAMRSPSETFSGHDTDIDISDDDGDGIEVEQIMTDNEDISHPSTASSSFSFVNHPASNSSSNTSLLSPATISASQTPDKKRRHDALGYPTAVNTTPPKAPRRSTDGGSMPQRAAQESHVQRAATLPNIPSGRPRIRYPDINRVPSPTIDTFPSSQPPHPSSVSKTKKALKQFPTAVPSLAMDSFGAKQLSSAPTQLHVDSLSEVTISTLLPSAAKSAASGSSDSKTTFSTSLQLFAASSPNVILPGRFQSNSNPVQPPQTLHLVGLAPSTKQPPIPNVGLKLDFLDMCEEENMPMVEIAHNFFAQKLMDKAHIAWGVQYEIARGVSNHVWKWEDVTPRRVNLLTGSNIQSAWKVPYVMCGESVPMNPRGNMDIWRQLDLEQKAMLENKGRGLGLMGPWEGEVNFYGGRCQQNVAFVYKKGDPSPFRFAIKKPESKRSHRIARQVGSRAILQVRVPDDALRDDRKGVEKFLSQSFVLCGRIYRPFTCKDGKVYLVETNIDRHRQPDPQQGDQYRSSFRDFLDWYNPLQRNYNQPISKWCRRWDIALSTSIPILEFREENIHDLTDIISVIGQDLSDGCGYINGAALTAIGQSDALKFPHRPVALQGRIAGAKGLWILHPIDQSPTEPPRIWIRDSQRKVHLSRPFDRAHRIFDLVAPARLKYPANLSKQTITNMSFNGVPDSVFIALMEAEFKAAIKPLSEWESPNAMIAVAKALEGVGHIMTARLQRFAGGSTRAFGIGKNFREKDDGDGDDAIDGSSVPLQSTLPTLPTTLGLQVYPGRESCSGAPIQACEKAYEMIMAGFHPLQNEYLYDTLKTVVSYATDDMVNNTHIAVADSVEVFCAPDPTNTLPPGHIYFRSSQNLTDQDTGVIFNFLTGPVIVGRNPTRVASDMQKVIAVGDHPALNGYYDVVLFSTRGEVSLASRLGGGDYDGDTVMIFWAKLLTDNFQPPEYIPEPDEIRHQFHPQVQRVDEFCKDVDLLPTKQKRVEAFYAVAWTGLKNDSVGIYSKFHDNAVYKYGYNHKIAIRLAYMFTTCLDSAKTGLRLDPDILAKDSRSHGRPLPPCLQKSDTKKDEMRIRNDGNMTPFRRDEDLPSFALESLLTAGQLLRDQYLSEFENIGARLDRRVDPLKVPFAEAHARAMSMKAAGFDGLLDELELVKVHVNKMYTEWRRIWEKSGKKKDNTEIARLARQFADSPAITDFRWTTHVASVKASYAWTTFTSRFSFAMAFRDLCDIQATAVGRLPITQSMGETVSIRSSFLRVLNERRDEY